MGDGVRSCRHDGLLDEGLNTRERTSGVSQIVCVHGQSSNWPVTVDLVLNASWLSNATKKRFLAGT